MKSLPLRDVAVGLPQNPMCVFMLLVMLYMLCLYASIPYCTADWSAPTHRNEDGNYVLTLRQLVHWATAVAFIVMFILTSLSYAWLSNPLKRMVCLCVAYISIVALVTYIQFVSLGVPSAWNMSGEQFEPLRYLEWSFTTPGMIYAIAYVTKQPWRKGLLVQTLVADILMMFFGFMDRFCAAPFRQIFFLLSMLAFFVTMRNLDQLFRLAGAVMVNELDRKNLCRVHNFTNLVWSLFPLIRVCTLFKWLDNPALEDMITTAVDLSAKLIYAVSLMVVSFTVMDQVLETRLQKAETYQKEEYNRSIKRDTLAAAVAETAYECKMLAYREAMAWRHQREEVLLVEGFPEHRAAALLDSTLSEYVALSSGDISAYMHGRGG